MSRADRVFFGLLQVAVYAFVVFFIGLIFIPMFTEAGAPLWFGASAPGVALALLFVATRKAPGFVQGGDDK